MSDHPSDRARYVSKCVALSVEERFKSEWDEAAKEVKKVSVGWFVRVSESSAVFVGMEKPDIKEGDKMRLALEHDR
jgi:hypothetical protein